MNGKRDLLDKLGHCANSQLYQSKQMVLATQKASLTSMGVFGSTLVKVEQY